MSDYFISHTVNTPPFEPNQHVPIALRALRQTRGWSLDKTAQETGVSKAMLGQIERSESSPTIATLWKIASGFHVSLSYFLEPSTTNTASATLYRNAAELRHQPSPDGMLIALLYPYEARFGFELLELTLLPGYERRSEAHEHGVTETVIVLNGEMEVLVENHWQPLSKGESVRFAADQPHGYRNVSRETVTFHNLIHYARPHL